MPERQPRVFDAVHEDANGRPDGYVSYEIKGEWHGGVAEPPAATCGTSRRRTRRRAPRCGSSCSASTSWCRSRATNLPVDEPLRFLLADIRQLAHRLPDRLGLGAARSTRPRCSRRARTRRPGKLAIEIVDPDGSRRRFALDGGPTARSCAEPHRRRARSLVLARDARRGVARRHIVDDARGGRGGRRAHARRGRRSRRDVRDRARARDDQLVLTSPEPSRCQRSMRASQRPGASNSARVGIISGLGPQAG